MNPGRTLVVRPGALGDALLTLPALLALRLSGAQPAILGTPASWAFMRKDKIKILDFAGKEWLWLFSGGKFPESSKSLAAHFDSALVYLRDGAEAAKALRSAGIENVLCAEPPAELERAAQAGKTIRGHAARRLLAPLQAWLVEETLAEAWAIGAANADMFISANEGEQKAAWAALSLSSPPPGGFWGLHPGSGGRRKCWPAANFARLATELAARAQGLPLVFFGPADDAVRGEFEAAVPPDLPWRCVANRPLREVLSLLALCRAYAGNDSGMTHLAARICPTLALFGPTDPARWAPLGKEVHILQAPEGNLDKISVGKVFKKLVQAARSSVEQF